MGREIISKPSRTELIWFSGPNASRHRLLRIVHRTNDQNRHHGSNVPKAKIRLTCISAALSDLTNSHASIESSLDFYVQEYGKFYPSFPDVSTRGKGHAPSSCVKTGLADENKCHEWTPLWLRRQFREADVHDAIIIKSRNIRFGRTLRGWILDNC
ncbi:hypothetical protein BGW80DRAFT_616579 [Lactifluus volemus]|nr:hypothetical protein BGW80DRAFT_616579 [Lactifluus volemus]